MEPHAETIFATMSALAVEHDAINLGQGAPGTDAPSALIEATAEAMREIQIGVINRHTMAERTVRYTERWRWDAAAGRWWIVDGLPDLWAGE